MVASPYTFNKWLDFLEEIALSPQLEIYAQLPKKLRLLSPTYDRPF